MPIGMGTLGGLGNESPFAESAKSLRTSIGQLQMADDHPFVGAFWKEIEKVETFYLRKSAELKGRLDVLLEQIHRMGLRAPKLASIEVESTDPFNINRDLQRRAAEVARTQGNTHGDSGESGGVSTPEHKHKRNPLPENHHHRNKHHHTNSLTQSLTLNSSVLDDSAITDAHELRVLGAHGSKDEAHDQFADSIVHDGDDDDDDDADIDDQHSRSIESIKIAFVDIYRQYCFLRDFCGLNYVAVIKIAKKYKKVSGNTRTEDWASLIHRCNFVKKPQLSHSIRSVEQSYASLFCHGSLINARRILLQKQRIASYNWGAYISGLRFGVTLMLMFWVIWDCLVDSFTRKAPSAVWMTTIFPIYRGCGCLVLLGWCWGLNVYVWDMNRVNWRYILELHPKFTSGTHIAQ